MNWINTFCKGEEFPSSAVHKTGHNAETEWKNRFYWGDVREALKEMATSLESKIQMVYMDPPFFTGQHFSFRQKVGEEGWQGNRSRVLTHSAYADQRKGGRESFLMMMREVLQEVYRMLAPEGCLYLHIDYRTSAYMRILLDEIFGEENFLNEIIWRYQSGGRAKRHFSRKHDSILFYRKTPRYFFNIEAVGKARGKSRRNHMKQVVDEEGRVFWTIRSGGKEYRYYEDSKVYPSDVWDDISHLQQKDPERTGYDTQKPEALLERMILASSRPGDLVADFFAGSGTTLAVAERLGRRWIGVDQSIFALHTVRKRLLSCADYKRMEFTYLSKDQDLLSQPVMKADVSRMAEGHLEVQLEKFHLPEKEKDCMNGMTLSDLDAVDYWAVGYKENGVFHVENFSGRTREHPSLDNILLLPYRENRVPALHIADIRGKQTFYELVDKA